MKVRDWMTRGVIGVSPDTKVGDVMSVLLRHDLNGIPVVNEQQEPVGIVTLSDIGERILPTVDEVMQNDELMANPEPYLGKTVRVEGLITGVCEKRGCWITLASGVK